MERFKKLHAQAKRNALMNININYGGKRIRFNLFQELRISEAIINEEIQNQPTHYAFISVLQKKLQTRFEELKQERKRVYSELYLRGKRKKTNNRPYSDEMCKAYVEVHPRYRKITDECIKARDDADILYSCVMAFIQKANLLQTLSSNNRKNI